MNTHEKQKILQKIYNHLKKQNKKAIDKKNKNRCKYRLERNGQILKCAIGCLIPDEEYNEEFEGLTVKSCTDFKFFTLKQKKTAIQFKNVLKKACKIKRWSKSIETFLQLIQNIHDEYPVKSWKKKFIEIAELHHLQLRA